MDSVNPTLTTCTFCGVGCGIYLEKSDGIITGAYPSMSHPANEGKICVRGWHVHEVASSPDRLKQPLLRINGHLRPVTWDEATDFIVERLQRIREKEGPDAIGFLNSPRCSNEESYLLQKFARAVVGTNNVHHGGALHRNNTIEALLEMIGVPAGTNSIGELEQSEVIVVDGIDLGRQLPTIGGRVIRAKLRGAKLIVTGSRHHRVANHADYFLQIRPDTDLLLYGAMAKVIVDRGLVNYRFVRHHCRGFEPWLKAVQDFDLLSAAERCGVDVEKIEAAAIAYGQAKSAMILYSTGVEARGKEPIQALVNLALLTGNIGREGSGLMPLAEYNNLQGICDMGVMPDRLPGYRPLTEPEARKPLEKLWGVKLPENPGRDIWSMLACTNGEVLRGVWIDRHNPVSTAVLCDAARAFEQMDLVVLQHIFKTDTARFAHVILPQVAFGEEDVTFTSTERRVQVARKAIEPPAGPMPGWAQLMLVANKMGANWSYRSTADVMDEIAAAVPFYSGISYENLLREYGRQWPCTTDQRLGTRYLFKDGIPESGFTFADVRRPPDTTHSTEEFPFHVSLGYSLYYWHRNILVKHSETLRREYNILLLDYPDGFIELNSQDATRLGIKDGSPIKVIGEAGSATSTARVTPEIRSGTVFVPFFQQDIARQIIWPDGSRKPNVDNPVFVRVEKA